MNNLYENGITSKILLFFCKHRIPLISKIIRVVFNCDIYCRLPSTVLLPHPYGVVIHSATVLGERVVIMQQVTLGQKTLGDSSAPVIGDDCYIGAGAKILGGIRIGSGVTVGANAVVTRDIQDGKIVVGFNRVL